MRPRWIFMLSVMAAAGCGGGGVTVILPPTTPSPHTTPHPGNSLASTEASAIAANAERASAVAACEADAKSIETALEAYKAQNNDRYPATLTDQTAAAWAPLIGAGASGAPYLSLQPGTSHYTIWYTHGGAVTIGPPEASTAAGSEDFDTVTTACEDEAE